MSIIIWVSKNWKLILTVLTVMFLLSLVGPITLMLRRTKEGMKEALTPLGFVVLLIILFLIFIFIGFLKRF